MIEEDIADLRNIIQELCPHKEAHYDLEGRFIYCNLCGKCIDKTKKTKIIKNGLVIE